MRGRAIIIMPEAGSRVEEHEFDGPVPLPFLRAVIGGPIEPILFWDLHKSKPCAAFCREDGAELPINPLATAMWMRDTGVTKLGKDNFITGPVVILIGDADFLEAL
jgi:hypothetical protein